MPRTRPIIYGIAPLNAGWPAALAAFNRGDFDEATACAERALEAGDGAAPWRELLALALLAANAPERALPVLEALTRAFPYAAEHHLNLGNCLCELGRDADALAPLERARELGADGIAMWFALARARVAHGELNAARDAIERALAAAPSDAELRLLQARILVGLDAWDEAYAAIDWLRQAPLARATRAAAGHVLLEAGMIDDAASLFMLALDDGAADADAALGLALAEERRNRLEAAHRWRARAMAWLVGDPDGARIAPKLAHLDARLALRRGDADVAGSLLTRLLADADVSSRAALAFELGHALDRLGDIDGAIAAFVSAHAAKRARVAAHHPGLAASTGLLAVLAREVPPVSAGLRAAPVVDANRDPLFVVGFPRSGTTLLEQLLDAHPALSSFDEQPLLQKLIQRLDSEGLPYPQRLDGMTPALRTALRTDYFDRVARLVPDLGTRRAVDKNPLNIARLALVDALFPASDVIVLLRDPRDVVLSCWQQNFRAPAFAVTFETLAATAAMYAEVMAHFERTRAALALRIHFLRYEDLAADVAREARRLVAALGLEWEPALLAFTERARGRGAISTPSYAAVTEPVHRRAVGRWRRYAAVFTPAVCQLLAPFIERYGYRDA